MSKAVPVHHVICNAVLFQCLWFAAVLEGWSWGIFPLMIMLAHFVFVIKAWSTRLACFGIAIAGALADSLISFVGVYGFSPDNLMLLDQLPLWLLFMWLGFSMSLPLSLAWLFKSKLLLASFFVLGGPMSYFAGQKLGALHFALADLWELAMTWLVMSLIVGSGRAWLLGAKDSALIKPS